MRKGKIAAQVAHASMKVFFDNMSIFPGKEHLSQKPYARLYNLDEDMISWMKYIFTKIVLGCEDEQEIHDLANKAKALKIPHAVITDAGKTEFDGVHTITCIALGPCKAEIVEKLTEKYSLM